MTRYRNHVSDVMILQSTRALAKFVRDHGGVQLVFLDHLVSLLEAGRFDDAARQFRKAYLGADGFNDWQPPVVFENEDPDYVQVVFDALTERWARLFRTAIGDLN